MVKEVRYTSIKRVLDNLLEHPLLRDLTLEQAVRYTIRFIGLNGFPNLYSDKISEVGIEDWRGLLPCDLVSIKQVKDKRTGVCLRAMTDNFTPGLLSTPSPSAHDHRPSHADMRKLGSMNPAPDGMDRMHGPKPLPPREPSFKTQGRVIFTSFPEGCVLVAYKSIPVDDDGFPLLMDNETYLNALEAYIKKQIFTIKFDTGKISAGILSNAQQDYAFAAGELQGEMTIPSVSEMQTITNMWTTLVPSMKSFDRGFVDAGDREYIRNHA